MKLTTTVTNNILKFMHYIFYIKYLLWTYEINYVDIMNVMQCLPF